MSGSRVYSFFDALPFAIALGLALLFLAQRRVAVFAYAGAFLVAASPWIAYSRLRFGRWFATDNGSIAFSTDPRAFVTDWWPTPQP